MKIVSRVHSAFHYLSHRVSCKVRYKRFRASEYDPIQGETKSFWEEVEFSGILVSTRERSLRLPEEVSRLANAVLAFPLTVFTRQPGEPQEPYPHPGDEIEIDGEPWEPDLNGRVYAWTDPTKTLYFLAVKKK